MYYFYRSEKTDARNSSIESDGEHNEKDLNVIPSAALKKSVNIQYKKK